MTPCGPNNNFYSAAGTGMGLVTETIMVELGECHSHTYDNMRVEGWNIFNCRIQKQRGGYHQYCSDP